MTGTRALGLPTASGCWRWSCSTLDNRLKEAQHLRQPLPPRLHPVSALEAPRSSVLTTLRALTQPRQRDDSCPLYAGKGTQHQATLSEGIDRPHSFRDDTQRNHSEQLFVGALGFGRGAAHRSGPAMVAP
jgi:hypothetical protein